MKWILSLALLASATSLYAEVSPEHVEAMLQQMVRENVISPEDALKAKTRMKTLSPDQWSAINEKATQAASRMPASVMASSSNKIEEVNSVDLDGAQFKQIQNEMRKIVPQN